ncbi:exosortase A [Variovorax sp. HJSM1_2]|uniref:exosortase A n=1 Tax=Variovorax sp. HJSM1_2 TaxID=3366263 RepID=UPI003BC994A8
MNKILLIVDSDKKSWIKAIGMLFILLFALFFLYRGTVFSMVEIWRRSETFTHCFLIFPIVLWLIWGKKSEVLELLPEPSLWALIPILLFGIIWLLGNITSTNSISQLSFVGLLVSCVVLVLGFSVARVIVFPLGFLFFAVPIGEFLLPTLMEWTASFTILALRLTGIPVYRDGLQFVIPSGNWSVVEACSGVRYLIASLTVGTLFAYLNFSSNRKRLAFVFVSIVVSVVANWLRAYMIVLLGHLSGNTIAVGVDHIIYGWLFFGIVIMSVFIIGIRWAEVIPKSHGATHLLRNDKEKSVKNSFIFIALIAGFVFLLMPVFYSARVNSAKYFNEIKIALPDFGKSNWSLLLDAEDVWKPLYQKPASEISGIYRKTNDKVGLYVGYYRNQYSDSKLISSANVLVGSQDAHWNTVYQGATKLRLINSSVDIKSTTLRHVNGVLGGGGMQMAVWQYYWIGGHVTDNDYIAKIYMGLSKLLGYGDDAAVVVLHVIREPGVDSDAVMTKFLQDNYSQIDELLHAARGSSAAAVNTIGKM